VCDLTKRCGEFLAVAALPLTYLNGALRQIVNQNLGTSGFVLSVRLFCWHQRRGYRLRNVSGERAFPPLV
jgi:hypothetical protein